MNIIIDEKAKKLLKENQRDIFVELKGWNN